LERAKYKIEFSDVDIDTMEVIKDILYNKDDAYLSTMEDQNYKGHRFTHLIMGENQKRTIKVLFAIAFGAKIVSPAWILDNPTSFVDEKEYLKKKYLNSCEKGSKANILKIINKKKEKKENEEGENKEINESKKYKKKNKEKTTEGKNNSQELKKLDERSSEDDKIEKVNSIEGLTISKNKEKKKIIREKKIKNQDKIYQYSIDKENSLFKGAIVSIVGNIKKKDKLLFEKLIPLLGGELTTHYKKCNVAICFDGCPRSIFTNDLDEEKKKGFNI